MNNSAREVDGLYILDEEPKDTRSSSQALQCEKPKNCEEEINLWHLRLGHPSFCYLKRLFPSLFRNKHASELQGEICELSKHHRTYFSIKVYTKSSPFSLIHNAVWGSSHVSTIFDVEWFISFANDHTHVC